MSAPNLATDAQAIAAYDEPGSWGRLSEGWAETPYTPGKWLLCTKANVVPYGQYVVVGSEKATLPGGHYGGYDYSKARIRCATVDLRDRLVDAHHQMFVVCRDLIEAELSGLMIK